MSGRIIDEVVGAFERNMRAEHAPEFAGGIMAMRETVDTYRIQALALADVAFATEAVVNVPLDARVMVPDTVQGDAVCITGWELEVAMARDILLATGEGVDLKDLPRVRAEQIERQKSLQVDVQAAT